MQQDGVSTAAQQALLRRSKARRRRWDAVVTAWRDGCAGAAGVSNKGGDRGFWASVPSVDAVAGIAAVMRARTKGIAQRLGVIRF